MATFPWWFRITDYIAPWLRNQVPGVGVGGVDTSTAISFDLLDDYSGVDLSTVDVFVDDAYAYRGGFGGFQPPYTGTVVPTIVDGYDGYAFSMSKPDPFMPSSYYEIRVVADDYKGNILDETWDFSTETSVIGLDMGPYEITLDVLFDGPMLENEAFLDPANYQFDGGMYTRLVERLASDEVRLWVELFQGTGPFTLTVSDGSGPEGEGVRDSYGAPVVGNQFVKTVFQSDATMSATNGLVRTWAGRGDGYVEQGSRLAVMDSQRVYLSGIRGIDVFRRDTAGTVVRWAQIMDEYGIDAMFVANYDPDYEFEDLVPPFLEDLLPAAGSTDADGTTDIRFSVSDAATAVEITATAIYVNGTLAFAGGSGGWANDWSGDIRVQYRSLDFTLRSPSAFSPGATVSVRVMASDLLDNVLDTTYTFRISALPASGFGVEPFGSGSFGGGA